MPEPHPMAMPPEQVRATGSTSCGQFAGIWLPRNAGEALPALVRQWATANDGQPLHDGRRALVFGFGKDRWPGPNSLSSDPDRLAIIVGEPIFRRGGRQHCRNDLLQALTSGSADDCISLLEDCHGSFAGLTLTSDCLQLFTDKIGIRGLFILRTDAGVVCFSTSKRMLAGMAVSIGEKLTPNDKAVAEWLAFGYSIGERTLHTQISRFREATVATVHAHDATTMRQYHHWRVAADETLDLDASAELVIGAMRTSVTDRLHVLPAEERNYAFLSGGMDSRFVVATLLDLNASNLTTLNFAPTGTLDAICGNLAAAHLGTNHKHIPATDDWKTVIESATALLAPEAGTPIRGLWWSGDGGSVGVGHVYLTAATSVTPPVEPAALARQLIIDNRWAISTRALGGTLRQVASWPAESVRQELERLSSLGFDRLAYAFFLFNDQRRHLDAHFDQVETLAYDLILPFFDARLIRVMLSIPSRHLLGHRLYNRIFARHRMGETPWQAYPGHEPCPHPMPLGARRQWEQGWLSEVAVKASRRSRARRCLGGLLSAPNQIDRLNVALACAGILSGLKPALHILSTAERVMSVYQAKRAHHPAGYEN